MHRADQHCIRPTMSNSSEYVRKSLYEPNEDFFQHSPASYVMTVCSTISALACLTIVIAFYTLLRNRSSSKGLLRIILYIAVSNVLTSLGSIVGQPTDRSFACWWEGIVTNIFTLCSIYWSLDVVYILYLIVVYNKARKIDWVDHAICWGMPVLATLLPLINFTYGASGGMNWCFIVPYDDYEDSTAMNLIWFWVSYYAHVWVCVGIMGWMFMEILRSIGSAASLTQPMLMKIYNKLKWYPVVVAIAWFPSCIVDTVAVVHPDFPGYLVCNTFSYILACSQGLMTACVFWSTFDEATHTAKQGLKMVRQSFTNKKDFEFTPYEASSMSNSRGTNLSAGASNTDVESAAENKGVTEVEDHAKDNLGVGHRRYRSVYEKRPDFSVSKEQNESMLSFVTSRLLRIFKSSQPSTAAVAAVAAPEDEGGLEKEHREDATSSNTTAASATLPSQSGMS